MNYVSTHQIRLTLHSGIANGAATSNAHEDDSVSESTSSVAFDGSVLSSDTRAAESNLEILTATITQQTDQFFSSETEGDPDQPSEGLSSIKDAIEAIREGKACPTHFSY